MSEQTPLQDSPFDPDESYDAYQDVLSSLEKLGIQISTKPTPMSDMKSDKDTIEEYYDIPPEEMAETVQRWNDTLGIANDEPPEYYSDLVWEAEKKKAQARAEKKTTFKMRDADEFFKERNS